MIYASKPKKKIFRCHIMLHPNSRISGNFGSNLCLYQFQLGTLGELKCCFHSPGPSGEPELADLQVLEADLRPVRHRPEFERHQVDRDRRDVLLRDLKICFSKAQFSVTKVGKEIRSNLSVSQSQPKLLKNR